MEIKKIQANGIEFAYYEQGSGDKLILCIHGFPDTADTWLDLMPRLADAGYRVVAPYIRGYPPTEIPAEGQFSGKHLAEDIIGLIDAFGAETAILIGHDWGALMCYGAVSLAPERITKLITVAIPHPRSLKLNLKTLIKARHFITFQFKGMSVNWMKRNNFQALSTIFKRWSPNWQFTDADLEPIRKSLSQAGGTEASLRYYWEYNANRSNKDIQRLFRRKTEVPTLSIFGEADGALTLDALTRTDEAFTGEYQQVVLPDVGHFLHREVPDKFAELVLGFLSK